MAVKYLQILTFLSSVWHNNPVCWNCYELTITQLGCHKIYTFTINILVWRKFNQAINQCDIIFFIESMQCLSRIHLIIVTDCVLGQIWNFCYWILCKSKTRDHDMILMLTLIWIVTIFLIFSFIFSFRIFCMKMCKMCELQL